MYVYYTQVALGYSVGFVSVNSYFRNTALDALLVVYTHEMRVGLLTLCSGWTYVLVGINYN